MMEPSQPISRPKDCPDCGAPFPDVGVACWLCGWKLGDPVRARPREVGPSKANPYAPPTLNPADLKWTFSLSTLFLWTALVAVVMGVVRIAPGLGIALAVITFPAALNTVGIAAYRKRKSGQAMTVPDKLAAFTVSVAAFVIIAVLVIIAAISALLVMCMASGTGLISNNSGLANATVVVASIVAVVAVIFVAWLILREVWRTMG